MKLWHLARIDGGTDADLISCVVRARDEAEARTMCNEKEIALQRGRGRSVGSGEFLDPVEVSCVELAIDGPSGVICADFYEP